MTKFIKRFESNTKGLEYLSTGFAHTCPECVEAYGFRDLEDDDGNVIKTAEQVAMEAYDAGKVPSEESFSWRSCDTCGSGLGGDRCDAHAMSGTQLVHLRVCVDCVVYIANGDEPELEECSECQHEECDGDCEEGCVPCEQLREQERLELTIDDSSDGGTPQGD